MMVFEFEVDAGHDQRVTVAAARTGSVVEGGSVSRGAPASFPEPD